MDKLLRNRLYDCTGLVAIITGGGTGIGLVMARALEANGARVYIMGRRREILDAAAATAQHGKIFPVQGDVTSRADLQRAAQYIRDDIGYVNLVIANAGVIGPNNDALWIDDHQGPGIHDVQEALWETPIEGFMDVYRVNITGVLYTATGFLDLLDIGNNAGNICQTSQILITSSIAAFDRGQKIWQRLGLAYTTSKIAVTHLTKTLVSYLIHHRIRVNAIAPGTFTSELARDVFGDVDISVRGAFAKIEQPLERGTEDGMAGTVLYYASQAGGYYLGSVHLIDGGMVIQLQGASY